MHVGKHFYGLLWRLTRSATPKHTEGCFFLMRACVGIMEACKKASDALALLAASSAMASCKPVSLLVN
jgi:hypothetical protein